jgi:hypothetical protein
MRLSLSLAMSEPSGSKGGVTFGLSDPCWRVGVDLRVCQRRLDREDKLLRFVAPRPRTKRIDDLPYFPSSNCFIAFRLPDFILPTGQPSEQVDALLGLSSPAVSRDVFNTFGLACNSVAKPFDVVPSQLAEGQDLRPGRNRGMRRNPIWRGAQIGVERRIAGLRSGQDHQRFESEKQPERLP